MISEHVTANISAQNNDLDFLKKYFSHCFDKSGNFNFTKFKSEIGDKLKAEEIDFSKESYGIDWLGKKYARLLASDSAMTLLKEDKDWNAKPENVNSENLLIKGDNLEILKHLAGAYYEKVKMIYIDPPYNTGSDGFVYVDDRKFTVAELQKLAGLDEDEAKRILEFTQSKSNSHSAWLTFIYPRLYIAKQLLRDDGVIFVSIDDNEVAQLRILMDEIFGEDNFVSNLIWEKVKIRKNSAKYFSEAHEHVLVFTKSKEYWNRNLIERKDTSGYKNPDNDPRGDWIAVPIHANHRYEAEYKITKPNGVVLDRPKNNWWRLSESNFKKHVAENRIWWGKGESYPMIKKFLTEVQQGLIPKTILYYDEVGGGPHGDKAMKKNFDDLKVFENPKSIDLIKHFLEISTNKTSSDLILDFFAGSGTTGEAVMRLNAEDMKNGKKGENIGKRKYILVQLPEPIDPKKNKTAYDFVKQELGVAKPTIFEITKERLIRAGKKIKQELLDKEPLFAEKHGSGILDTGFKIFETESLEDEKWENFDFKAERHEPQQELFDESKLDENDIQTLLTTWKTSDNIPLTQDLEKVELGGYIGYYANKKLYLMDAGFNTKHLKALLEKIDDTKENKDFCPTSIIVFAYNFESKSLREFAENVSSYENKKGLEIDFIKRY